MATETYYYFKPDSNLRAAYGGAAILDGGDSAEVSPATLCQRAICRSLGLPAYHTQYLFNQGVATDTFTWMRVPAVLYSGISAYLTAAELATATTTMPAGWALSSKMMNLQPHPTKTNVIVRGDSISAGLGTTSGSTNDTYAAQAIGLIETLTFGSDSREAESKNYCLRNLSLGGSSWANTAPDTTNSYPENEAFAYNQRTRTIPMNGGNCIFIYWLGTNDLSYDETLSAADCWARAAFRIGALAAEFPNLKIIIATTIKRGTGTPLNVRINDYNTLIRANYLSAGAHVLMDFEARVPEVNIVTGNVSNTTYYTDSVHLTTLAHSLLAPVARDAILAAKGLF